MDSIHASPPSDETLGELSRRWEQLTEGEKVSVASLVLDMGGSSELTDTLHAPDAHRTKEAFRRALETIARRWGASPCCDWSGDATAFLFWEPTHAVHAAMEILAESQKVRNKLDPTVLDQLTPDAARGFRIAGSFGELAYSRSSGRCTGNVLDMAGHLLEACPAPGFIITRSMYDSHLLKHERALFDPVGPQVEHVGRRLESAVLRLQEATRSAPTTTFRPSLSAHTEGRQTVQLHGQLRGAREFEIQMYWGFRPTAHEDLRNAILSCNRDLFIAGLALTTIGDVLNDPQVLRSLSDRIVWYPDFRRTIITLTDLHHARSAEPGGRELAERLPRGRRLLRAFYDKLCQLVPRHIVRPLVDFRTYRPDTIPRHFLLKSDVVVYFGSYLTHHQGAHSYLVKIQDFGDGLYGLFRDEIEYLRTETVPYDIAATP